MDFGRRLNSLAVSTFRLCWQARRSSQFEFVFSKHLDSISPIFTPLE
jgi:hypothetical protein